jgi:thymidylate synthase ThyX
LNKHAQWEIRGIFSAILEDLKARLPAVFSDLEAT